MNCQSFKGLHNRVTCSALKTLKINLDGLMVILVCDSPILDLQEGCGEATIEFVCLLYDNKSKYADINCLRYTLFSTKSLSVEKLPPPLDKLTLHLRRAATHYYYYYFHSYTRKGFY